MNLTYMKMNKNSHFFNYLKYLGEITPYFVRWNYLSLKPKSFIWNLSKELNFVDKNIDIQTIELKYSSRQTNEALFFWYWFCNFLYNWKQIREPLFYAPLLYFNSDIKTSIIEWLQINYWLIWKISQVLKKSWNDESDFIFDEIIIEKIKSVKSKIEKFDIFSIMNVKEQKEKILNIFEKDLKQIFYKNVNNIQILDDNEQDEYFDYFKTNNDSFIKLSFYLFSWKVETDGSTEHVLNEISDKLCNDKSFKDKNFYKIFESILSWNEIKIEESQDILSENLLFFIDYYLEDILWKHQKVAIENMFKYPISYIQGPPWTWKSHTILNAIIIAFLFRKKVLFVSRKEEALSIVKTKLDEKLWDNSMIFFWKDINLAGELDSILNDDLNVEIELKKKNQSFQDEKIKQITTEIRYTKNKKEEMLLLENSYYNIQKEYLENSNKFLKIYWYSININDLIRKENISLDKLILFKSKYFKKYLVYKSFMKEKIIKTINTILKEEEHIKEFEETNFFKINLILEQIIYFLQLKNIKIKLNKDKFNELNNIISNNKFELKKILPDYLKSFNFTRYEGEHNKNLLLKLKNIISFDSKSKIVNKMKNSLDFKNFLNVFSLCCWTIRDLNRYIPLNSEMFDIVIIDESSQCNIAEIVPFLYRAKNWVIVWDDKQLGLESVWMNMSLNKNIDLTLYKKHWNINEQFLISNFSILDLVSYNLNNTYIPKVLLTEHYRSLPNLAKFTSWEFYSKQLQIMTENWENSLKPCFKAIKTNWIRENWNKIIYEEISKIKEIIIAIKNWNYPEEIQYLKSKKNLSFGVVCFTRDQSEAMNSEIERILTKEEQDLYNFYCGTIEEFQWNEKDIIFLSLWLDDLSSLSWWFYHDLKRQNVRTSRAKFFTYFLYSREPNNYPFLTKYLSHFWVEFDSINIPSMFSKYKLDYSKCESEFEKQVLLYLSEYCEWKRITILNQVEVSWKRLDFVLYDEVSKKSVAIEVDWKQHFIWNSRVYTEEHIERIEFLEKMWWNIINVKYYNWFINWYLKKENPLMIKEREDLFLKLDNIFIDKTDPYYS